MPPKDQVWSYFERADEKYQDDDGENKARVKCTCRFCHVCFVFRNVEQLQQHLACPDEGIGKHSGCAKIKEASPAVRNKYASILADRQAAKDKKSADEVMRVAIEAAEKELKRKQSGSNSSALSSQRSITSSLSAAKVRVLVS